MRHKGNEQTFWRFVGLFFLSLFYMPLINWVTFTQLPIGVQSGKRFQMRVKILYAKWLRHTDDVRLFTLTFSNFIV